MRRKYVFSLREIISQYPRNGPQALAVECLEWREMAKNGENP